MTISLERVRLNAGGYDSNGRYFGVGAPLYRYLTESGKLAHVRARNAKAARTIALKYGKAAS